MHVTFRFALSNALCFLLSDFFCENIKYVRILDDDEDIAWLITCIYC